MSLSGRGSLKQGGLCELGSLKEGGLCIVGLCEREVSVKGGSLKEAGLCEREVSVKRGRDGDPPPPYWQLVAARTLVGTHPTGMHFYLHVCR